MICERDFIDLWNNNDGDIVAFGRAVESIAAQEAARQEREAVIRWAAAGHADTAKVGEIWAEGYNSALEDCVDDMRRRSPSPATPTP